MGGSWEWPLPFFGVVLYVRFLAVIGPELGDQAGRNARKDIFRPRQFTN